MTVDCVQEESREEGVVAMEEFVTPLEALGRVELYLLWITRLAVVLVTQVAHTHILLHLLYIFCAGDRCAVQGVRTDLHP